MRREIALQLGGHIGALLAVLLVFITSMHWLVCAGIGLVVALVVTILMCRSGRIWRAFCEWTGW